MPVRTYRGNVQRKRGRIFIPKNRLKPHYKFEIKYNGDSAYTDITEYCLSLTTTNASRVRLPSFNVVLDNYNGRFKNKISGGEHVRVTAWYEGDTTYTLINARVEKDNFKFNVTEGYTYELSGRAFPEFNEEEITVSFDNALVEDVFEEVVGKYSSLSFTKPNVTTERLTQRFQDQTGLSILRSVADKFELEFYIDHNGVVHLFKSDDNKHDDVAIVMGQNLMSMESWGRDWKQVKNRIKIHGKQIGQVQYYKVAEDSSSQSQFWIKDLNIYDSTVDTNSAAIDRASGELNYYKSVENEGRFETVGMLEVIPGYKIYLSIPYIVDEYVTIRSFSHRFVEEGGFVTYFTLNKEPNTLAHVLVERMKVEEGLRPPELSTQTDESIVVDFKSTTVKSLSFTNTEVLSESAYLIDGQTSGSIDSSLSFPGATTTKNTSKFIVVADGENLEKCSVSVSNDSGLNSVTVDFYSFGEVKSFSTSSNKHAITINLAENLQGNRPKLNSIAVFLINTT